MFDVMDFSSLSADWQQRVGQISLLLQSVALKSNAKVLVMLCDPNARSAVALACTACHAIPVLVDATAPQEVIGQYITQHQPCVVVCMPSVFGWVSKLAFLAGSKAIYTCGNEQEGTLLDRAQHFEIHAPQRAV